MNSRTTKLLAIAAFGLAGLGLISHAALPLVNTPIGNQAKATYTDDSNVVREVFSNTVITRVTQIYALDLEQNNSRIATPGSQVYFPHTVTNLGNGPDTFALSVAPAGAVTLTNLFMYPDSNQDGLPDSFTSIITTSPLAPGAEFHFVIVGIVPPSATAGQTGGVTVVANSSDIANTASASDTNNDIFTVTNDAVMQVNKAISTLSGLPGTTVTYTLTYTNTGNSAATAFTLTDVIPTFMSYVDGSAKWSVFPAAALSDASDGNEVNANGLNFRTLATPNAANQDGSVEYVIANVAPGASGFVTFQAVINAGTAPQILPNTAVYGFITGGNPAGPFNSNTVPFTVIQIPGVTLTPPAVVPNANAGDTVTWSNALVNTGTGIDTFDITVSNTGLGANSAFPAGTTFQLFQTDGNTPMTDSNGNGIPDTGPIAPAGLYNVVIKAILPGNIANGAGPFAVRKVATSTFNPGTTDDALDVLTVVSGASVDLTNNFAIPGSIPAGTAAAGDGLGSGATNTGIKRTVNTNPNTTAIFTLVVNNTGPGPDTFNLLADDDGTFGSVNDLPAGWTVVFKNSGGTVISNTGVIPNGGNRTFTAEVFVPAGVTPQTQSIFFRSLSPVTGAGDSIQNSVAVNTIRNVSLQTDNVGQTFPGGSVVYEHILTNNGNVTEGNGSASAIVFTLSDTLSGSGFTSITYYDINGDGILDAADPVVVSAIDAGTVKPAGLVPGEQARFFVKVFAPLGAPDGASNVTVVTATTTGVINLIAAPAASANSDTTSVIRGDLNVVKRQRIDNGGTAGAVPGPGPGFAAIGNTGNGVLDGGEGAFVTTQLSAPPRSIIVYEITVTNTGSANATGITINDTIPANTTYFAVGAQGIANVTGGTVNTVTAPANGGTGALVFNVGTLAPTETATITFAVKINE